MSDTSDATLLPRQADDAGRRQNSAFTGPGETWWTIPEAGLKGLSEFAWPNLSFKDEQRPERECGRCGAFRGGRGGERERQVCRTQHSTFFPRDLATVEPCGPAELMSLCRQHPQQ